MDTQARGYGKTPRNPSDPSDVDQDEASRGERHDVNRGPGKFKDTQGQWPPGRTVAVGDLDGDGRDGLFVYDPETGAWSRHLTGNSKKHDKVDLVEESGTWAPGWSIVGRP